MGKFLEITIEFLNYGIFIFAVTIMVAYVFLAVNSIVAIRRYFNKRKTSYFDDILRSPTAPKISIIAPAYNESKSIVANIRSLLSLHYNNYEIIIVNDGSKDDSMMRMIAAYDLEPTSVKLCSELPHKPVKEIYRSRNLAFKKLIVIDKENGGKADALNTGINYSDALYVANVDVDCVIEDGALLRMVKPFMESIDKKIIATGGVIRIANDCVVREGRLLKVNMPKKWLPRFQTLEYIRAFLLGRMAWSRLNGLLLISGAFGLFDRKVLVEAGGYDTSTVGEDMELVVRMRVLMHRKGIKYGVEYIPDPLCWTECPEDLKMFTRQRNRWTRGTIETLASHKILFFNPRFGILGLLSYPFWFFFEWMAPLVEFSGLLYFGVLYFFGLINWHHFWLLIILVYSFAVMYSWLAVVVEELTFKEYTKKRHLAVLMLISMIEPIMYHPITVWAALRGNYDKFIKKTKTWGEQTRTGFGGTAAKT